MPDMPFGKYRGQTITAVPDGYLKWCLSPACEAVQKRPHWQALVKEELQRRYINHIHVAEGSIEPSPAKIGTPESAQGDAFDPEAEDVLEGGVDFQKLLDAQGAVNVNEIRASGDPIAYPRSMRYGELKKLLSNVLEEFLAKNGPELNQSPHINAGAKGVIEIALARIKDKLRPTNDILTEDD